MATERIERQPYTPPAYRNNRSLVRIPAWERGSLCIEPWPAPLYRFVETGACTAGSLM